MGEAIITLLVAIVAGSGASIITSYFGRPKIKAEAAKAQTDGNVAVSGDARAWAQTFADRADRAETRSDAAEKRAAEAERRARHAEQHADQLDDRCDDLEAAVVGLTMYARQLQAEMKQRGWTPPDPPPHIAHRL